MRPTALLLLAGVSFPALAQSPRVVHDFAGGTLAAAKLEAEIQLKAEAKNAPASLTIQNVPVEGDFSLAEWNVPFILRFSRCDFRGSVNFDRFASARSLIFENCVFEKSAELSNMRIGRDFLARNCRFLATQSKSGPRDNQPTTFIHSVAVDNFYLNGSVFEGPVNLRHLNVGRDLYLQDTVYRGSVPDDRTHKDIQPVLLEGSQIGHFLRIDHILEDHPSTRIAINDCTFAGIFAQTKLNSTEEKEEMLMLRMLEGTTYRAEAYHLVEHEFVRRGRQDLADEVYIRGRDRETDQAPSFTFDRLRGNTLRLIAGYGRKPAKAFAWCLFAVLIGAAVFVRDEGGADHRKRYLRSFWYSLDLFVPIVSVSGKEPEPPTGAFARSYVRIHRILGWLLLPIALAAISGVVGKS